MVSNTLSSCCFGVAVAVCLVSVAAFPGMRPRGPMPAGYVNLTAAQKQAYLWSQVTADETSQPWFNTLEQAPIFLENMETTFEDKQDYPLPTGHKLYIHTVGWVAKFRYEAIPGNNTYTGAFEGAENGIMRFSFATEPSSSDGIIPAAAWKFLRTGVLSANLFTMWGLAPQPSFNFFERVFTTHLPQDNVGGFLSKLVVEKFKTTTPCYLSVGTSPLSEYEESGAPEASPNFPFQVFLVPNPANAFADTFPQDWAASFAAIKPGTLLYEVHAISDPAATPVHIGNLYSDSDYVPSKFGDTQLFFEHARMSRDFDLRPQWKAAAYKDLCT